MKRLCLIMSGVSGSGKSTLANLIKAYIESLPNLYADGSRCPYQETVTIASTDDYWTDDNPFDGNRLGDAHIFCWRTAQAALDVNGPDGTDHLIVDNTNLAAWQIHPYYMMGVAYYARVVVIRVHTGNRPIKNIHNVSDEKVRRMMVDFNKRDILPRFYWPEVIDVNQDGNGPETCFRETIRKLGI